MAEHTPNPQEIRTLITAELVAQAERDPAFRARLLADPRAAVAQQLGLSLPAGLSLVVHEETPQVLHLVLPLKTPALAEVAQAVELGDREVAGFADKSEPVERAAPRAGMQAGFDVPPQPAPGT